MMNKNEFKLKKEKENPQIAFQRIRCKNTHLPQKSIYDALNKLVNNF